MTGLDKKGKLLLVFLIVWVVYLGGSYYRYSISYSNILPHGSDDCLSNGVPGFQKILTVSREKTEEQVTTDEKLRILTKVILNARKHVRGSKTAEYLKVAVSIIDNILNDRDIDVKSLYKRSDKMPKSVCPEVLMGSMFGFPLYHKGFVTKTCDYAVHLHELITIIKYIDKSQFSSFYDVTKLIHSINETYSNVHVLIAMDSSTFTTPPKIDSHMERIIRIINTSKRNEGYALNKLIEQVTTPYVLVTRNMQVLTNDTRLERLIGEIESLDVVAAGGAFRYPNGHWGRGCFQTAYKNYTLKYLEGYDESFHECVFCDYIHGPFVTTTKFLKQNKFENLSGESGLYEDWFINTFQNGRETIVCPDSMFWVNNVSHSNSDFQGFLRKWKVYKMFAPSGQTFNTRCEGHATPSKASLALSPCNLKLNNDAVKLIMRLCEETNVVCELQEGTALGALKMGKSLPWEYDFDIRFLATNCTKCKNLEKSLKNAGLSFIRSFSSSCCSKKLNFGERIISSMRYRGYFGDFDGHPVMDSNVLTRSGLAPTKILLEGQWVNVPRNPGLALRNRYGKEIYQHAEHWRYTGGKNTHQNINYTTNMFLPCKYPGRHDCLDRYNGDGILQFVDVLP